MALQIKTGISELFSFPLCIVSGRPDFEIHACNNAFEQLTPVHLANLLNKPLFEEPRIDLFTGREDVLQRCLSDVEETHSSTSLTLYDSENLFGDVVQKGTWLLEISLLNHEDTTGHLLLTFHKIPDADGFENKSPSKEMSSGNENLKNETQALKDKVQRKHQQYRAAADELDNFVYSVSHDLRAPLRRIDGFSQELMNEYANQLDETGAHYLQRIRQGAQDMASLIDDLLKLSRISRQEIQREKVNIAELATNILHELLELEPDREAELTISQDDLQAISDPGLTKVLLTNLISNALKFTSNQERTEIELGKKKIDGDDYFYIKDNGVGFDPAHSNKLFRAFSRLHSQREFKGTGIGLATVQRIITLHNGKIFAQSTPGDGAAFYFNLP